MFWEIFTQLCANIGESPNKVAKKLSIASGTVTEWKKGRIPQNATLKKLADFFGVSVDYLLGKEKKPSAESEELIKKLLEGNTNKAHYIMFGGAAPEVREIPPEAEAIIKSVLETFDKKNTD